MKYNEKLTEKIEAEKKMSVNDFLNDREVKMENRNTVLQSRTTNFLKVLLLGYDRIELQDKKKRQEHVEKMIESFQNRDNLERQEIKNNKYLASLGNEIYKNRKVMGEINLNK